MVTGDGDGASHELVRELDPLASQHGYQVIWSAGWALSAREQGLRPPRTWPPAPEAGGATPP